MHLTCAHNQIKGIGTGRGPPPPKMARV